MVELWVYNFTYQSSNYYTTFRNFVRSLIYRQSLSF